MSAAVAFEPAHEGSQEPHAAHDLVESVAGETLRPAEVVRRLDEYIIGQHDAKRSVAIALRNRVRRRMLPEDLRNEVLPKNILMIGPTGVGKTEMARTLAQYQDAGASLAILAFPGLAQFPLDQAAMTRLFEDVPAALRSATAAA